MKKSPLCRRERESGNAAVYEGEASKRGPFPLFSCCWSFSHSFRKRGRKRSPARGEKIDGEGGSRIEIIHSFLEGKKDTAVSLSAMQGGKVSLLKGGREIVISAGKKEVVSRPAFLERKRQALALKSEKDGKIQKKKKKQHPDSKGKRSIGASARQKRKVLGGKNAPVFGPSIEGKNPLLCPLFGERQGCADFLFLKNRGEEDSISVYNR